MVGSGNLGALGLLVEPADTEIATLETESQTALTTATTFTLPPTNTSAPTQTQTPMPSITPTSTLCEDTNFGGEWAGTLTSPFQGNEDEPTIFISFTQIGCNVFGTKTYTDPVSGLTYTNVYDGKIVKGRLIIKNCDLCREDSFQLVDGNLIGNIFSPDGTINYRYILQRVQ